MLFTGKVITLKEPWATFIAQLGKTVENRTWPTNYRGPLAIHAGKGWWEPPAEVAVYAKFQAIRRGLFQVVCQRGGILAICTLADCVPIERLTEPPPWAFGPYCWILTNVVAIEPVAWRGAQGLRNVTFEYELVKEPA